jgi:hypothetical protein
MKKTLLLLAVGLAVVVAALAALPTYKTITATGTTSAIGYFPADPNSQIRVVGYSATSDLAGSTVIFATGYGAYYQTVSNATTTSVTNYVNTTNGLSVGQVVLLQHGGTCYPAAVAAILAYVNGTNASGVGTNLYSLKLGSGGWGVQAVPYDDIYVMSNVVTIACGATTSVQNGEAIYVGNYGRPVSMTLNATSACTINWASAHYDSQSQ